MIIRTMAIAGILFAGACAERDTATTVETEPAPKAVEMETETETGYGEAEVAEGPTAVPGAQEPGLIEDEVPPVIPGDVPRTQEIEGAEDYEGGAAAELEADEEVIDDPALDEQAQFQEEGDIDMQGEAAGQEPERVAMLDQEQQRRMQPGAQGQQGQQQQGTEPMAQEQPDQPKQLTAQEAKKLSRDYPAAAEPERVTGAQEIMLPNQTRLVVIKEEPVVLKAKVCVSPQGKPQQVQIIDGSGFKKVDQEATKQMRQWTYEPREVEGEPVAFCEIVSFELQG